MIATKDTLEAVAGDAVPGSSDAHANHNGAAVSDSGYNTPHSRRVYVEGELHPVLRVAFLCEDRFILRFHRPLLHRFQETKSAEICGQKLSL
jgi:hypothetical protein